MMMKKSSPSTSFTSAASTSFSTSNSSISNLSASSTTSFFIPIEDVQINPPALFLSSKKSNNAAVQVLPWIDRGDVTSISESFVVISHKLYKFDPNAPAQLEELSSAAHLRVAKVDQEELACALLTDDGRVFTWTESQMQGSTFHKGPAEIFADNSLRLAEGSLQGKFVVDISVGSKNGRASVAAITNNGELHTWGCGLRGVLCHGDEQDRTEPKRVECLGHLPVQFITNKGGRLAIITTGGFLYLSGLSYWDLKDIRKQHEHDWEKFAADGLAKRFGTPTRVEICGLRFVHAAISHSKVAAVTDGGALYSWALEQRASFLGHDGKQVNSPSLVGALSKQKVKKVWMAGKVTAALTRKGRLWSWGAKGAPGQGDGGCDRHVPKKIGLLRSYTITSVFWNRRSAVAFTCAKAQISTDHRLSVCCTSSSSSSLNSTSLTGKRSTREEEEDVRESTPTITTTPSKKSKGMSENEQSRARIPLSSIQNIGQC